ncbi:MAG: hypothetical protein WAK18_00900 [Nocardioidaceae bacterium]
MIEQPVSVRRETLAVALRDSTDPLALEALESLNAEVPEEVPLWDCERADLLATYQERADRGRRGEGPATRRTDEYVAVLAASSTPDRVGEVGWASGPTYYVTLLQAARVLAICTVARAVWPIGEGFAGWHAFGTGSGFKDVDLIKNALEVIGSDADPHAFRPLRLDEVTCGPPKPESADAWYQASTLVGVEVAAFDHARARLYLTRR